MGILDKAKGAVRAITPKPVEDALFGREELPPTPTNPDDARQLIDNVIGREPGDTRTVNMIRDSGRLASGIPSYARPGFVASLYDEDPYTRLATGNLVVPTDQYITADQLIGDWLQQNPRRQALYMRETDPLNPLYIPYFVEANAKHHDGLFAKAKNVVGDIVKRPIGGALELLAKPAQEVETWYGNNFVWNDIPDASLRNAMAKYTYESRLNVKDWGMTWEQEARVKAYQIDAAGLHGDAAVAEFEEWVKTDGRPKTAAFMADMFGQILFDPLWFVPTGAIAGATGKGTKAITGTEDITKLGRLATAAGRRFAGENTIRDLFKLDELNYAQMKLAGPTARGPMMWLTERSPDRLADAAVQKSIDLLSGPLHNAAAPSEKLQILAQFDQLMKTGRMTDQTRLLFGEVLSDPVLARMHVYTKGREKPLTEGILEGLTKNPQYLADTHPDELNYLLTNHMMGTIRSAVRDGQYANFPKWFTKGWLPVVTAQKMVMGIFSLARPGFVVLNMANNFFTFMWHAAGHPMSGTEMFGRSLRAELSTIAPNGGHLPDYYRNLAHAANLDPVAIERTVVGNVSHQDVLGQKLGYPFRLDDDAVDVNSTIAKAQKAVNQPIKDMNPLRFRDLVAWPVTVASRVDRMARRATFYYNLRQQLHLIGAPERLLTKGVPGSLGGLMPDMKTDLIRAGVPHEEADYAEGFMYDHMLKWMKLGKGSLGDEKAIRSAYLDGVNKMLKGTYSGKLSAFDFGMQFMARRGVGQNEALYALQDIDEVMVRVSDEVFAHADDMPMEQLKARLDRIADEYWTTDRLLAEIDHSDPVIRPNTDYSQTLAATEEGIRADLKDSLLHLERYLDSKAPLWSGNAIARRRVMRAMSDYSTGRLTRLSAIRRQKIDALADATDFDEAGVWSDYFKYVDDANEALYKAVYDEIAKVDKTNLKPVEAWYEDLQRVRARHQEITAEALKGGKPEDWARAGKEVGDLYRKAANRRAGRIFRWQPNEPQKNLGATRPTAALANLVDEYIDFVKGNLGVVMGRETPAGWEAALRQIAHQKAVDAGARGPEIARHIAANARAATDFVMLNYNNQYGMDNMMQMVFPYEFFPTRTAMNWVIRAWRQPGAAAMISKMLLNPAEYAETYGMPERLKYKIPIPIPGLDNFMANIPGIGAKVQGGEFANIYWVDPLAMLFPMANFRDDFVDEQRRSTPSGLVADWMEQNTPLSLSPVAKIVGSFLPGSAGLERDAWVNSLFSGGPFGVPLNVYARGTLSWLQTGDDSQLPPEEQELYSDSGYFSSNWLSRALNLSPDKYEFYRTERALASLVAEGKITGDDAWEAMRTRDGEAWKAAEKASEAETFLQDFTGWLGFRVSGSLKGEQIRLGQKALYNEAADKGQLEAFYEKFPEYEIAQVAAKGISDPEGRKQLLDTHFYYRDVERLVEQPYQKALDDIQNKLDAVSKKATITQTDQEYITLLKDQQSEIREEQSRVRSMVETAYPNRRTEKSLNMPPKERALSLLAGEYYDIEWEEGEGYEDFLAKRERWLDQFPAKTGDDREQDWQGLFVAYQATAAKFNLAINAAYDKGDFAKAARLREQKESDLTKIHKIAGTRVTRYDMELYLASNQRSLTQGEIQWEQANSLFDLWMSYVSDESPLTDRQKAAVSAYFRQDPLLRKHYNVGTIDIRRLNGDQLLTLARRREIWNHYYSLESNAARIDYMMAVKDELNEANAILGLPNTEILDYRPAPPDVMFRNPEEAGEDFRSGGNISDFLREEGQMDPTDPILRSLAREEGGLSMEDMARYVDPTVQRGY